MFYYEGMTGQLEESAKTATETTGKLKAQTEEVNNQSVGYDNLKKTIQDCADCAISEFGQWQEAQTNLFQGSYIGEGGKAYEDWKNSQIAAIAATQAAMDRTGGAVLGQRYDMPEQQVKIGADTSEAETKKAELESSITSANPQMRVQAETSAAMSEINQLISYVIGANPVMYVQVSVSAYAGEIAAQVDAAVRSALASA